MTRFPYFALLCVSILVPAFASASPVTYDFTGTVTSVSGGAFGGITDGSEIVGTITIDFANAIAAQSCGTIGATTATCGQIGYNWRQYESTGQGTGITQSAQYVFSISASVGSNSIDLVPGTSQFSFASGNNGYNGFTGWQAENAQSTGPGVYSYDAQFNLGDGLSAYDSNGLPTVFSTGSAKDAGSFVTQGNALSYNINSLTLAPPVPLPAAAWLLLSGLGGLGAFARRKRGS